MVTFFCLLAVFLATLVHATVGFGNALILMPVLSLMVGLKVTSPLVALISVSIHVLILSRQWRQVDFRSASRLVLASFLGMPIGFYLLKGPYETALRIVLGLLVGGYAVYGLLKPVFRHRLGDAAAYPFGFVAGILGGAYNINGPPVIIYGAMRGWPPATFRATLQGYFFPCGIGVAVGHYLAGLWTPQVFWLYGCSLLPICAAVHLGRRLGSRMSFAQFDRAVYFLLLLIGLFSLGRSLAEVLGGRWH